MQAQKHGQHVIILFIFRCQDGTEMKNILAFDVGNIAKKIPLLKNVKFFQNNGIFNLLDKGYSFSSFFGSRVSLYKESSLKTSNAFCNTLSSFNPDNNSPFW